VLYALLAEETKLSVMEAAEDKPFIQHPLFPSQQTGTREVLLVHFSSVETVNFVSVFTGFEVITYWSWKEAEGSFKTVPSSYKCRNLSPREVK
jgi:hypothetical protein